MKENKRFRKIYDSKVFWAIISLLISLIIWSYVSGLYGYTMEKKFSGVQVEFEGESSLLTQKNLAVTNVDNMYVNVTLKGDRTTLSRLSASDIKAVLDVSKISQPDDFAWAYDLVFPAYVNENDFTVVSRSPDTIKFSVVKNAKISVPVKGSFEGSIADGCVADELVFEPETITVEGPENLLSDIDYAWVSFGEGVKINASFTVDEAFTLMSKSGEEISVSGLKLSVDKVTVTQPIMKTRELPLAVNIIPGGGYTEEDCVISIEPGTIIITGDTRLIDDMTEIVLGTVDLASFNEAYEQSFPIVLDEGVENITGVTEAVVRIELGEVKLRTMKVTNISCKNCSPGYNAVINSEYVDVTLRAPDESVLNSISSEDVSIIVDLADYGTTTGQIRANGTVEVAGVSNVGAVGEVKVVLTIVKD